MFPYYLPFIFLAFASIQKKQVIDKFFAVLLISLLIVFVGLRYEVGADWGNYLVHTIVESNSTWSELNEKFQQPGLTFAMWYSINTGLGLAGVNLINAAIFVIGLITFCKNLKYPYLALLVAYPYLVVVVGMSFVNQSAAIGLELLALNFYLKEKFKLYVLFIIGAILFHASAVYLLTIPIVDQLLNIKKTISIYLSIIFLAISFIVVNSFFLDLFSGAYSYYFERRFNAGGFLITGFIFVLFCLNYYIFRKKFQISSSEKRLINSLVVNSIVVTCLGLYVHYTSISSVVFYRLSLYFLPLQVLLSCRFAEAKIFNIPTTAWKIIFVTFNFTLLFVWLNFATHSHYWIPYKNYLFL